MVAEITSRTYYESMPCLWGSSWPFMARICSKGIYELKPLEKLSDEIKNEVL